jgi:hypothetical protein
MLLFSFVEQSTDKDSCFVYIHCPIAFVLNWIEKKIFFASFDRMARAYANVIYPTVFLVRKESIFNTFKCFTASQTPNGYN